MFGPLQKSIRVSKHYVSNSLLDLSNINFSLKDVNILETYFNKFVDEILVTTTSKVYSLKKFLIIKLNFLSI